MILYFFISLFISFLYTALIMRVWSSWTRMKTPKYNLQGRREHQFLSVIVVGRNEQEHISECLRSIANTNYPKQHFEILFVDDHSEDETVRLAESLEIEQLKILSLSNDPIQSSKLSFKKKAIQYAITQAQGDIVVCTDADCVVPIQWLSYIDFSMQQALVRLLVMPISFEKPESILSRFQSLDAMATSAFTSYGIKNSLFYSANGANLAFRKDLYDGLNVHEDFASGDDIFLVQAVADDYPESVKFLKSKNVIVKTYTEKTWGSFWNQRKRWATKSSAYSSKNLYKLQAGIFLFHLILCANIILGVTVNSIFLFIGLFQFLLKGIMDYLLLTNMADFFNQGKSLKLFLISFLLFTPYLLTMAYWAVFGGRYLWKGRDVK